MSERKPKMMKRRILKSFRLFRGKRRVLYTVTMAAVIAMVATMTAGAAFVMNKSHTAAHSDAVEMQTPNTNEAGDLKTRPGASLNTEVNSLVNNGTPQTEIFVDGMHINNPQNGSWHKVYKSKDGEKTDVNVSSRSVSSGSNMSSSSVNIHVNSSTDSFKTKMDTNNISP